MKGFTVIEFVTAILLVAILGASVSSRWFDSAEFYASTASAEVLAVVRLAQRVAIARPEVVVSMTINQVGDEWRLVVQADAVGVISTLHSLVIKASSSIAVTAGGAPALLSATNNLTLTYDALGNITAVSVAAVPGTTANGVSLQVAGSANHLMCISPLGFAHAGNCI